MTESPHDRNAAAAERRVAGPGLLESLMWVSGYHAAQMLAGILLLFTLTLAAFGGWPPDLAVFVQVAEEFVTSDPQVFVTRAMGAATLGALLFILPAAFWRLRPSPRQALGARLPTVRQTVLLAGAVLPLGILSDELYRATVLLADMLRPWLLEQIPILGHWMENADMISLVQQQTASTAYPVLLVVVGLGPAIGEEVIFRGLIGKGLIARRGVVSGVVLTSLLFAMAHLSPAHAVATLPIAVFLHVAYLATGSIWAPILVHFLNNALSVTTMKYGLGQDVQVSAILLISAAVYVTAIAALLFFRFPSAGHHPSPLADVRERLPATMNAVDGPVVAVPTGLMAVVSSGALCFTSSFVVAALAAG
ncbi:MAG: CPBP family intramembrane metalloprotease [Planctomycetaceae bacterium]|nr:CPBP family intramembrane metalloprotease [Planctomycetaceae bacterium]